MKGFTWNQTTDVITAAQQYVQVDTVVNTLAGIIRSVSADLSEANEVQSSGRIKRSVPAISDVEDLLSGKFTQNVSENTSISTTQYNSIDTATYTNVDVVETTAFTLAKAGTTAIDGQTRYYNKDSVELSEVAQADIDLVASIGKYYYHTDKTIWAIVGKGVYADIATARTGLGTSSANYQLLTPIPFKNDAQSLKVYPNGTIYYIFAVPYTAIYSNKLSVKDSTLPFRSTTAANEFKKLVKVDITSGVRVETDVALSSVTIDAGLVDFTISGALEGETYYFEQYYDSSLSTIGTIKTKWGVNLVAKVYELDNSYTRTEDRNKDFSQFTIAQLLNLYEVISEMFKEQESVAVTLNATTTETDILHFNVANTRYILRDLTLKAVDPGADTITVRLYGLVNDVLTLIDTFDITTANFATYFSLMDMFGIPDFAGDEIKVTIESDANSYAVTGQYSYAKSD